MRQALLLDRPAGLPYHALVAVGLLVAGAGCTGGLKSIAPANLLPASADTIEVWAAEFQPRVPLKYELRWRFENNQGSSGGRATVRYTPPDTLRFDYRGPFGKSGSAVIVGSQSLWAEPEGDFQSLVPVAPILWAALGIVVPPAEVATTLGREDARWRAWRYVEGEEAIDFIYQRGTAPRLQAELHRGEQVEGVVAVELAPSTRRPDRAVMRFPGGSKLTLTVQSLDSVAVFAPGTWQRS
jgi:hypothetical protein